MTTAYRIDPWSKLISCIECESIVGTEGDHGIETAQEKHTKWHDKLRSILYGQSDFGYLKRNP